MKKKFLHSRTTWIALILILLICAIRFFSVSSWFIFDADQETLSIMVKRVVIDHQLTLIGMPTSVGGMFIGPYLIYFLIPFYLLMGMSPFSSVPLLFLNTVAVLASLYFVSNQIFSSKVAIITLVLYGFSQLISVFDRTFWNPTLMPLMSIWLLFFAWKFLMEKKIKFLLLAAVFAGLMAHLHFTFVFGFGVIFFLPLMVYLRNPRKLLVNWLASGSVLMFFLLPLLVFDLRHDYIVSRNLLGFLISGPEKTSNIVVSLSLPEKARIFFSVLKASLYDKSFMIGDVLAGIVIIATLLTIWIKSSWRSIYALRVLSLMIGIPFLVMMINRGPFLPYYLLFCFPAWFMLLAWMFNKTKTPILVFVLGLYVSINLGGVVGFRNIYSGVDKDRVVDFIVKDAKSETFKVDFVHAPGLKTGFEYLFWFHGRELNDDMKTTTTRFYKVAMPFYLVPGNELVAKYGEYGVVRAN